MTAVGMEGQGRRRAGLRCRLRAAKPFPQGSRGTTWFGDGGGRERRGVKGRREGREKGAEKRGGTGREKEREQEMYEEIQKKCMTGSWELKLGVELRVELGLCWGRRVG